MGASASAGTVDAPNVGASMGKQLRSARHEALMEALVEARDAAGLSQRELAKRLNRSHSFVGKIESGERQLNVLEFCEYVDALAGSAVDIIRTVMKAKG
jgi:DNA-binding transcriptional regulator YiaG